ncbi:nonribosomal peptide synthetase [Sporothrix schenckii 1099-18]|uniref:Nonribosomal peptide synthetase n=1 Tax=Sporothrix schenckii 1099-18 TaxID=1397361 RepID=A0A0F2MKA5_SPOSC|nr:nonribosomal peptide synthetase [Sporothrix schenckii 1099-18]KJR90042.1 nonribosomal peptide synthetase [Sporothrix schenckii 1099-18]
MSSAPHPEAGRRLLPHIADQVAADTPDRVLYEYPSSADLTRPWTTVTARQFANAVDRAAHWIRDNVHDTKTIADNRTEVLGYSGPPDLRYYILVLAAVKAGFVMLYTSLRNSPEGDAAVLEAAGCTTWLQASRGTHIQRVVDLGTPFAASLRLVALPELGFFLDDSTPSPPFSYTKTWDEGRRDPVWVLHTSGSTGHPKPVTRFLDSVAFAEANTLLRPIHGRPLLLHDIWGARAYLGFPMFHAAGLNNGILWPLVHGGTIVLGPPDLALNTADVVADVIRAARPAALYLPPSLLEDLAKDEATLQLLGTTKAIGYAGGPLSHATGNRIVDRLPHTVLHQGIGTTETGWLPAVLTDRRDWFYTHVHPDTGCELQDRGGGLYELVCVRQAALEQWQPIFSTFPDLQAYPFRDLFSRHPDPRKSDLYRYEGRIDNVLVLSNGEKVQPQAMELAIVASPLVGDALVVGQGRFQTALLVQPSPSARSLPLPDFLAALAPVLDEANRTAPAHAHIHADFVLVGDPSKPFVRTGKGTIRRAPTVELYKDELDALYERAEAAQGEGGVVDFATEDSLRDSLREAIKGLASTNKAIADDDDFFVTVGLDSLQVLTIRRQIARDVPDSIRPADIAAALIYRNPSLAALTRALWEMQSAGGQAADREGSAAEQLLAEYSRTLQAIKTSANGANGHATNGTNGASNSHTPTVVLLTGSTGSLGSHLLNTLLHTPDIDEVWCLNRAEDGGLEKQKELQARLGTADSLETALTAGHLHFRRARLADDHLGLHGDDYARLQRSVTHILHTQWQVDFNLAVSSFKPHLAGIVKLVELAASSTRHPHVLFTSSVGIANRSAAAVPEQFLSDFSTAGSGYGESKLLAELLLQKAAAVHGLPVTVVRVGQISGPVTLPKHAGIWNPKEWFPSLVAFSAHTRRLPTSLGRNERVDWIPADHLAQILLEFATAATAATAPGEATLVHAVHPRSTTWSDVLLPSVLAHFKAQGTPLQAVALDDWVATLVKEAQTADDALSAKLSALRLVPFLSSLATASAPARPLFDTSIAVQKSATLQSLPPIAADSVEIWLRQWGL